MYSICLFVISSFSTLYFPYMWWINASLRFSYKVIVGNCFNIQGTYCIIKKMLIDKLSLYNNLTEHHMQSPKTKKQQLADLQDMSALPQKYKALWVTNQRLLKQIDILKMEICQKDRIIKQLKVEIDSNILENTKNKLEFLRMVEDEVNEKTQQAKQEYLSKATSFDLEFQRKTAMLFKIEKELAFEKQQNAKLCTRIRDLKDHIIVALDEKDLLINQLTNIVNRQEMEVKVEQIKRETISRYGLDEKESQRHQYLKMQRNAGKQQQKSKEGKFQSSKVQIKRNI